MIKKFISMLLCCIMLLSMFCVVAFASDEKVNYLLLGDSITEGFGIANPYEASYGKIVADTNGYNYTNDSRMARDSDMMLYMLKNYQYIINDVKNADIISLSIGANDYLSNDDVVMIVAGALLGINNKTLEEIKAHYYENLCEIISRIKELNPDVTILMQTVYVAWTGFAGKAFSAGASRVNEVIYRYIDEHPGEVTLCDISPAMTGHPENLADDCVHPNDKGNVEIARLVLKQLYNMGLGTETTPVINAQGINYNYFKDYISNDFGGIITVLVKLLTGNAKNIRFSDIYTAPQLVYPRA